jgi:hypothetical protein
VKRRYVVQRHDVKSGNAHFDFMIEKGGEKLATWRLEKPLSALPGSGVLEGERSFDHRALYLDFEGDISGGRGRVAIVERGSLEDTEGDPDAPRYGFAIGSRRFVLETGADGKAALRLA